jgi:hypothetical protein
MTRVPANQSAVTVEVRERSDVRIKPNVLHALQSSRGMRRLIENGVVSVVCGKQGWALRGHQFVGTALLESGLCLQVAEKTPGALRALLASAMPSDARRENVNSFAGGPDGAVVFIAAFSEALSQALRRGRHREWAIQREVSLAPKGSLDIPYTIEMRRHGRRPEVAQRVSSITADTCVNRLLKAALVMCERWFRTGAEGSQEVIGRLRRLAVSYADIDPTTLLRTPRRLLGALFRQSLSNRNVSREMRQALIYAQTIVLQSFIGDGTDLLDEALFWDLETLFESAVRNAVGRAAAFSDASVLAGEEIPKRIFRDNEARFRAHPDVVVKKGPTFLLVADCKYVDVGAAEFSHHSHVYQLLAHASAYGVNSACLFYPGASFTAERLGVTRDGVQVHAFTVRACDLAADVRTAIRCVIQDNQ